MTQLLIQGSTILAQGLFVETADEIRSADAIYPKHVIEGWQIVECDVPVGFTPAGYTWDGGQVVVKPAPAPSQADKESFIRQIDVDVDEIYSAVIGGRATEYALAESEAAAYKAAGYVGDAPASVQTWAVVKNQTAQWAADNILTTATTWRAAQSAIRANRLRRKEDARNATTADQLASARQAWASFRIAIRTQLGI